MRNVSKSSQTQATFEVILLPIYLSGDLTWLWIPAIDAVDSWSLMVVWRHHLAGAVTVVHSEDMATETPGNHPTSQFRKGIPQKQIATNSSMKSNPESRIPHHPKISTCLTIPSFRPKRHRCTSCAEGCSNTALAKGRCTMKTRWSYAVIKSLKRSKHKFISCF